MEWIVVLALGAGKASACRLQLLEFVRATCGVGQNVGLPKHVRTTMGQVWVGHCAKLGILFLFVIFFAKRSGSFGSWSVRRNLLRCLLDGSWERLLGNALGLWFGDVGLGTL